MAWVRNGSGSSGNGWGHDGRRGLWNGSSDKAIKTLSTEKRVELTFPESKVLVSEFDSDAVHHV